MLFRPFAFSIALLLTNALASATTDWKSVVRAECDAAIAKIRSETLAETSEWLQGQLRSVDPKGVFRPQLVEFVAERIRKGESGAHASKQAIDTFFRHYNPNFDSQGLTRALAYSEAQAAPLKQREPGPFKLADVLPCPKGALLSRLVSTTNQLDVDFRLFSMEHTADFLVETLSRTLELNPKTGTIAQELPSLRRTVEMKLTETPASYQSGFVPTPFVWIANYFFSASATGTLIHEAAHAVQDRAWDLQLPLNYYIRYIHPAVSSVRKNLIPWFAKQPGGIDAVYHSNVADFIQHWDSQYRRDFMKEARRRGLDNLDWIFFRQLHTLLQELDAHKAEAAWNSEQGSELVVLDDETLASFVGHNYRLRGRLIELTRILFSNNSALWQIIDQLNDPKNLRKK